MPKYVSDEASFVAVKDQSRVIGPVKSFEGFILDMPEGIDLEKYNTVLIWCEAFSEFITAATYR